MSRNAPAQSQRENLHMNHLEFAASESAALLPTAWEKWIETAEKLAGHHLDGDQSEDGYSLDGAFVAYKGGLSPRVYVVLCGISN
jgi:hypothetical protein